jgi:hypothetical protein
VAPTKLGDLLQTKSSPGNDVTQRALVNGIETERQSKLNALVAAGTPFAQYKTVVDGIESMIGGILQRLSKQRVEGVLIGTYGHCNFGKLARAMTEQARLHPSVLALETFSFAPRLASLRDSQITQQVVDAAASNAGKALQRLLELVSNA